MATDRVHTGKLPLEGRAPKRWHWALVAVGFAALIGVGGEIMARYDRAKQARLDAYWRVDGPPCAPLDPVIFRGLAVAGSRAGMHERQERQDAEDQASKTVSGHAGTRPHEAA